MAIQVPMYQLRLPQFQSGGVVRFDSRTPDEGSGLAEALRLASANKQQGIANQRQTGQDALAEEIARGQLGQAERGLDIDERSVAQRERSTDVTEQYRQGYLKMQSLKALLDQGTDPQQAVDAINKQFAQPTPQAEIPMAKPGGAMQSPEPFQYEPQPGPTGGAVVMPSGKLGGGGGADAVQGLIDDRSTPQALRDLITRAMANGYSPEEIAETPELQAYLQGAP